MIKVTLSQSKPKCAKFIMKGKKQHKKPLVLFNEIFYNTLKKPHTR
jgi:hypothetical protein